MSQDITIRVLQQGGKESLITVPDAVEFSIELPGGYAVAVLDSSYDDHPAPEWWKTAAPKSVKLQAKRPATPVYYDPEGRSVWSTIDPTKPNGDAWLVDFFRPNGDMLMVLEPVKRFPSGLWVKAAEVEPR